MRRLMWNLILAHIIPRLWSRFKRRATKRVRMFFSIHNLFGENAGTWWDMRRNRLK